MNKFKWKIKPLLSDEVINQFPEILPQALQLLWDRGLTTQSAIDEFLHPDYSHDLHDPYLFKDMSKAVERLYQAKDNQEKIAIYGDYDADGVCGSAILAKVFQRFGFAFTVYLPDREKEGYGLNAKAVEYLSKQGVKLIVTVDCGISNNQEIELANSLGLEVIITDHHHVPETLPQALAIIHPKVDAAYPFKELAGGGVAFKLAQGIIRAEQAELNQANQEAAEKWLLDLVAISTVADMVPLVGENRTLVKFGLVVLAKTKNLGLQKLFEVAAINPEKIDTTTIGFQIAPRINAAGRMQHANTAYELLTTANIEEAITIAHQLNKHNLSRQSETDKMVEEAKKLIGQVVEQPVLFAAKKGWNPGLIGLVASKLTQEYGRPSFALAVQDHQIVASGRSIEEFNLIEAMDKLNDYFLRYGGHKGAAGFSMDSSKLDEFKEKFTRLAGESLKGVDLTRSIIIDQVIKLPEVTWDLVELLEQFEPFGWGNFEPRFLIKDLIIESVDPVGLEQKHLRLMVTAGNISRKIICFGFGNMCDLLKPGDKIQAICEIGINQWNGNREIQLKLIDLAKM